MSSEGIDSDRLRLPFQTQVQIERDPRATGSHFPAIHAATNRVTAQAIGSFHQYHIDAEPGGGQRRAKTTAPSTDHCQLTAELGRVALLLPTHAPAARWQPTRSVPRCSECC